MESKASISNFYFLPTVAQKKACLTLYLYMKIIRPLAFKQLSLSSPFTSIPSSFAHYFHQQLPLGQTEMKRRNN
jgi:hypothetical protein